MNKPEWIPTNIQLKQVANCHLDEMHPHLACDRTPDGLIDCQHCPAGHYCGYIAKAGAKAVLEYIRGHFVLHDYLSGDELNRLCEQMLKELD